MTTVTILPIRKHSGDITYQAVAGKKRTTGKTAGEALDALTAQLAETETGTLAIVQNWRPDRFFSVQQQQRLEELMVRWRLARNSGKQLPPNEQSELEKLIDKELHASAQRAAELLDELKG